MSRIIFSLCGDSYPDDRPGETALRAALEGPDSTFVSHPEIFSSAANPNRPGGIELKASLLEQAIRACDPGQDIFLLGRSSGARVATLVANRCKVTAVACLFYPFRALKRQLEPVRFTHLRTLARPTLIVQGTTDEYGGLEITENYQLSEAIRLHFVPGDHKTKIASPAGADIVRRIRDFIDGGWRETGKELDGFDEEFYLRAYPEVAKAVAEGVFGSGEDHFRNRGRRECRMYRIRCEEPT
jgi:pimeloyl-ACP methyl ester carboxylesterase